MNRNVPTQHGIANWSETRWLGSWNPDAGVGFYLHAGRFRHDVELWWAQTVVYLPDGMVGVDRSWGRAPNCRGVTTSVFTLHVDEPGGPVTSTFDGALEVAPVARFAERPLGAGGNSVPVTWRVETTPLRPQWSMYDQLETKQDWADGGHTEQHHRISGELTVGDRRYRVDGPAFDDHSNGIRQWDGFGSHIFFNVPFDDFGLHLVAIQTPDGEPAQIVGAVTADGAEPDPITAVTAPLMADPLGAPHVFDAVITTRSGRAIELAIEVLHCFPMTITDTDNDNINGLDWDVPGNPLFLSECIARYTTADGTVGYGHLERSARRERINRLTLAVDNPWSLT